MSDLAAARAQTALLFAFHMIFAVAGMGMPLLAATAEGLYLRTDKAHYLELAKRWARGTAVLFAVGAVSGTMLTFELGLLWPRFMAFAGGIIGLPFALEGFAFFAEAIFLGIYLYGWERIPPHLHFAAGLAVAAGGALSGILVVSANAWMNSPAGFLVQGGVLLRVDPVAAMFNPAWPIEAAHMTLAAYAAAGFAAAGIHARCLMRSPASPFHRAAVSIALSIGGGAALLLPLSGDWNARFIARDQPVKLAAMEGQFRTERGAPLRIGGIPDAAAEKTRFAIEIPYGLSLLSFHDPNAEVKGLDSVPPGDRPDPLPVHVAFQVMVACGVALAAVSVVGAKRALRAPEKLFEPSFLRAVAAVAPLGMVAVEAGWVVTEAGRQPWVVRGVMRTFEAVTFASGLSIPFAVISVSCLGLFIASCWLIRREIAASQGDGGECAARPPAEEKG